MANIQDIAERSGLSTATVSRYLNGRPYVSERARSAIERAMAELDYHPNSAARTLRSGKTRRVTVVLDMVDHPFYAALLAGFSDAARSRSYEILVQQSQAPDWSATLLLEQAAARAMDGVIVAAETEDREALRSLIGTLPVVACDQALFDAPCPQVYIDHYRSAIDGLAYLHRRGARTIACIHGARDICPTDRFRRRAYADFAAGRAAPTVHELPYGEDTIKGGHRLLEPIMALSPRPDAVFTGSDDIAAGLLAAAREAGVCVPSDLAILGFDDLPIAEVFDISTIRQPVRQMGRWAMEIAMRLIERGPDAAVGRRAKIKYHLITRSTA
ncbi:MAG: LacI family transcriptional regulator [Spirochaetales bacterium]|nr:LacI family transcriptional regulator [Spirochaetales bacterium]